MLPIRPFLICTWRSCFGQRPWTRFWTTASSSRVSICIWTTPGPITALICCPTTWIWSDRGQSPWRCTRATSEPSWRESSSTSFYWTCFAPSSTWNFCGATKVSVRRTNKDTTNSNRCSRLCLPAASRLERNVFSLPNVHIQSWHLGILASWQSCELLFSDLVRSVFGKSPNIYYPPCQSKLFFMNAFTMKIVKASLRLEGGKIPNSDRIVNTKSIAFADFADFF